MRRQSPAPPQGAYFSPVSGKFRRLVAAVSRAYPGVAQVTISGFKTSRHYLAVVPQSTLPVIELKPL